MRVGLAQINTTIADFAKNAAKTVEYMTRAKERRCDLLVFPEMSLFGYGAGDLLERKDLIQMQLRELKKIHKAVPKEMAVLIGCVIENSKKGKPLFNAAALLIKGKPIQFFCKELLPSYDVFEETRHFQPGDLGKNFFTYKGKKIGVTICEDIWAWGDSFLGNSYSHNPLEKLKSKKLDLFINLSASPFAIGKHKKRLITAKRATQLLKAPIVYVNLVGAQDELIFDGGSFALDKTGKSLSQSLFFEEDLNVVDFEKNEGGLRLQKISEGELLRQALVLGIRDFARKNQITKLHLGLSGGIDSAVVACLAADALGPAKVSGISLPGPHSSAESYELAKKLAMNLGISFHSIPIVDAYESQLMALEKAWGKQEFSVMHENLQARTRGIFLMAFSNKENSMLLNTGNKAELAVGYSTLYGDMCGGLSPLGDLLKQQVYLLAKTYNLQGELIPKRIMERAPTAELRPNQKDQDSLPEYDELDAAIHKVVVECKAAVSRAEKWTLQKILQMEFKRWQSPPILRVSLHAFGRGRRYPISHQAALRNQGFSAAFKA